MELFHEYHNRFFTALVALAERIAAGETISETQFDKIYFESGNNGREHLGETFLNQIKHNTRFRLFDFSDRNAVKLAFDVALFNDISNIPLKVERVWCEAALSDCYAQLFFDGEDAERIRETVADSSFPYYHLIDNSACDMTMTELHAVLPVFRQTLGAIQQSRGIRFCYGGETVSGTPLRIIYDESQKQFSVLLKHNIGIDTYDMTLITDFSVNESAEKIGVSVKQLMEPYKAAEPIVFEVTDHKNRRAIERAVITFSVYDHIVRMVDEKKAEITINYYQYDLDDVVRRILSFGTDAVILSPDIAIEHMKKILRSV